MTQGAGTGDYGRMHLQRLEDDRKDAECELSRYEDARLMHEAAERTMHSPFLGSMWDVIFL
jgi:hypothetical protein